MDLEDGVNCTAQDMVQVILQEEELGLPRTASTVFTLWMCSGLVGELRFSSGLRISSEIKGKKTSNQFFPSPFAELQLKPHHKPYELRHRWGDLVNKFSNASESRRRRDEPALSFQRNVFFSRKEEEKIK